MSRCVYRGQWAGGCFTVSCLAVAEPRLPGEAVQRLIHRHSAPLIDGELRLHVLQGGRPHCLSELQEANLCNDELHAIHHPSVCVCVCVCVRAQVCLCFCVCVCVCV